MLLERKALRQRIAARNARRECMDGRGHQGMDIGGMDIRLPHPYLDGTTRRTIPVPRGRTLAMAYDHSHTAAEATDWKTQGVKVIPGDKRDPNTAQTPGMSRATAINRARAGAEKIWAGTVVIHPNAKTGAHHHGDLESVIFVVKGRARMRWGEHLEYVAEAGPGDFIYVPPYVPHQEINASRDEELECVLVRSGQEPVVVNLDITPVEPPEQVLWKDPIHK
jgi:uncharacterized RmlC-like cupin family protein